MSYATDVQRLADALEALADCDAFCPNCLAAAPAMFKVDAAGRHLGAARHCPASFRLASPSLRPVKN